MESEPKFGDYVQLSEKITHRWSKDHNHNIDEDFGNNWCLQKDCARPAADLLGKALRASEKKEKGKDGKWDSR